MKRPLRITALLLLALPLLAAAQPWAEVTVSFPQRPLYIGEDIPMRLEIKSREIRLDEVSLEQMPAPSLLQQRGAPRQLGQTRTLTPEGEIIETQASILTVRPLTTGTITIAPRLRADLLIQIRTIRGSRWSSRPSLLPIEPVTIHVRPLPPPTQGAPFSGAIGQFRFKSVTSPKTVVVGDLITVQTAVIGTGNRDGLVPPKMSPERHFRVYEPRLVSETAKASIFEQTLVPQSAKGTQLPPLTFVYFDPEKGRYVRKASQPVQLVYVERTLSATTNEVIDLSALIETNTTTSPPPSHLPRRHGWRPQSGERLVLAERTAARMAPGPQSMETFHIDAKSEIRVLQQHHQWLLVQAGNRRGWIPAPSD